MPTHDSYARITPYELAIPDDAFASEHFGAVAEEAEARDADLGDPGAFAMLMAAGQALRELRGPDEAPERIREHAALLYHAFHFWKGGRTLLLLDTPLVRSLVSESPEASDWVPRPVHASAYVQLPQHLVWVPGQGDGEGAEARRGAGGREAGGAPESVDGFFWAASGDRISFLLAMGLRSDRPGFGVVPLPTMPLPDARLWISETIRPGGGDFGSELPGAELEGLYEIRTAGEVLKLAGRVLWLLDRGSCTTYDLEPAAQAHSGDPGAGPRPSALPYLRLTLD